MYKTLTKFGQPIAFGIGLLIIVVFFLQVTSGIEEFNTLAKEDKGTTGIFNLGLSSSIILILACAAAAVLFGLYHMVDNPRGAIKLLIGLVVLAIVFFILYSSAPEQETGAVKAAVDKFGVSIGESKFITAAIKTTLALAAIAVVAFVVSEVRNFFK